MKEKKIVLDLDGVLREPISEELLPGSTDLLFRLMMNGVDPILWTMNECSEWESFIKANTTAFEEAGIDHWLETRLQVGEVESAIELAQQDNLGTVDKEIIDLMRKKKAKDPRLFGVRLIVDDDPIYGTLSTSMGYVWVDPNRGDIPNRDTNTSEWIDAIVALIKSGF